MAPWRNIYLYAVDHDNFKLPLLWKANNILRMIEATITKIGRFLH
jgi:hypothetical protein